MAYFKDSGSSASPEPGYEKAILCGLTMFRTAERLINPKLSKIGVAPFAFRLGIDYGFLTIARLGAPKLFNSIVAVGIHANVASKMLAFGSAGEIIIGNNLKDSLAETWKKDTSPVEKASGFVFKGTNIPYLFFRFTGRWPN
jgi:class 3 adenylate cyclase